VQRLANISRILITLEEAVVEQVSQEVVPAQVVELRDPGSSKSHGKPANMAQVMLLVSFINLERRVSETNQLRFEVTGQLSLNSQRISLKS